MASCMLHAKSLPQRLWAEALNCATYIQNRSPHRSVKDKIPYEAWSDLKLEVTHFRIFGLLGMCYILCMCVCVGVSDTTTASDDPGFCYF
jgi:hypothetical protein